MVVLVKKYNLVIFAIVFCNVCVHCMRRPLENRPLQQLNMIRRNSTVIRFAETVEFRYFNHQGGVEKISHVTADETVLNTDYCAPNQKYAIIVHGWTESCNQEWILDLVKNLIEFRGGCIMCMDYSRYSTLEYGRLVRSFEPIAQVLTAKLHLLEYQGFADENGYMFGFSFGGQLVSEAGRRFGYRRLKQIDICDLAGPGFDYRPQPEHRNAAENVQCIHTSSDKGTRHSLCDQDWKMGNCGNSQIAAGPPPKGSHGLCPYFYNSAFRHNFYAYSKPRECNSRKTATSWPVGFKMGYIETRKELVHGELFSPTTEVFPFTLIDSNRILESQNETFATVEEFSTIADHEIDFLLNTTEYSINEIET